MTSCKIGPVSTPISLAVQENSFIHKGKERFLCLQSMSSSIVLGGSSAFFQKMEIYILFLNIWIQSAFKDNSGYHLMVPI